MYEARKKHGLLPDLLRIREPRFFHQAANSVFGVVREARMGMKQTGQEAVRAGLSTSEVEQVKKAARSQDTPDLAQRRSLLLRREVVARGLDGDDFFA